MHVLPETLTRVARETGLDIEEGTTVAKGPVITYVTHIGSLRVNHYLVADEGLRIVTNLTEGGDGERLISTTCISDPISTSDALLVIERWGLFKDFEAKHDLDSAAPAPRF